MTNPTALKFGYPKTKIVESARWLVLVRPQQPTFGSLVLVCKEEAAAFSELSAEAFAELRELVSGIEQVLGERVAYERINYLMLMMVDRDVHFHVIPRYDGERTYEGHVMRDAGWPGAPALGEAVALSPEEAARLASELSGRWPASA